METLSKEEKTRILKALEEDLEFRYAIAGYLGLSEVIKRLDSIDSHIIDLHEKISNLYEGQKRLWENQEKLWIEVKSLRENQENILVSLNEIRTSFERVTMSIEDEARDIVRIRLKNELGVELTLDRVWVGRKEVNIYGASNDLCIVGEAAIRLGVKLLEELEEKIELIKRMSPDLLKPKLIKVVYTDYAIPSALEYAKAHGIWILKWSGDLTPRVISELKTES